MAGTLGEERNQTGMLGRKQSPVLSINGGRDSLYSLTAIGRVWLSCDERKFPEGAKGKYETPPGTNVYAKKLLSFLSMLKPIQKEPPVSTAVTTEEYQ